MSGYSQGHLDSPDLNQDEYEEKRPLKSPSSARFSVRNSTFSFASIKSWGQDEGDPEVGYPLRRFFGRTLLAVVFPPALLVFYGWIWLYYLEPANEDNPVQVGSDGALWAFYAWFLAATLGMNLSKYGLVGVEAGMLMESTWKCDNLMQILMHAEHTWSGPSGWINILLKIMFFWKKRKDAHKIQWPSKLWFLLALLSAMPFIALPLSGLCMELSDGYTFFNGRPRVLGRDFGSFNQRLEWDIIQAAQLNWKLSLPLRLPAMGIVYTKESINRQDHPYLMDNRLPNDDGVDEIFLAPQAEVPVFGKTWGLVARYNCSIARSLSEFTILNKHTNRTNVPGLPEFPVQIDSYNLKNFDNTSIFIRDSSNGHLGMNIQAYAEIGVSGLQNRGFGPPSKYVYYNPWNPDDPSWDYPGLEKSQILEYILYQGFTPNEHFDATDASLDATIPELGKFYKTKINNSTENPKSEYMQAIGVRCSSSSAVGHAIVDGRMNTYRSFERTDTAPAQELDFTRATRLSEGVAELFLVNSDAETASGMHDNGYANLRSSVQAPRPVYLGSESTVAGKQLFVVPKLLQAEELMKSLLQAYAGYSLQLMYDGIAQFDDLESITEEDDDAHKAYNPRQTFIHPNVTSAIKGKVLGHGALDRRWPIIPLTLWALSSMGLALWYGFRRRWAETFDGYSLFRFGADLGDQIRESKTVYSTNDYEDCEELRKFPGLVGDSRPDFEPGRISLVRNRVASKNKVYR